MRNNNNNNYNNNNNNDDDDDNYLRWVELDTCGGIDALARPHWLNPFLIPQVHLVSTGQEEILCSVVIHAIKGSLTIMGVLINI